MKLFYSGPLVNAELLVVMLEKHGIASEQRSAASGGLDPEDLNSPTDIFVPEEDYDHACRLFYTEREDEL